MLLRLRPLTVLALPSPSPPGFLLPRAGSFDRERVAGAARSGGRYGPAKPPVLTAYSHLAAGSITRPTIPVYSRSIRTITPYC